MAAPIENEFSFLSLQQREWSLSGPVPHAERLELSLSDGRTLSGIRYGDKPPIATFLHGAGLNAHTWDTTILAAGLPAVAIDLPGHGDSSWRTDANYAARTLAPDVAQALRTWTERPQRLIGHSLGGLTAAAVASAYPELVEELMIVDITPGVTATQGPRELGAFFAGPTDWASRDELVDRALAFGLGGSREAASRGVFFNSRVRPDGRVEWKHHFAHLAAAAMRTAPTAQTESTPDAVASALAPTGWDDLAGVTAPLTLVRGDRGYVSDVHIAEFISAMPTAHIETVASAHNIQEEAPDVLGALVAGMPRPEHALS